MGSGQRGAFARRGFRNHLAGVTAVGLLGAGAVFGQQEAARNAAAAASRAIFIKEMRGLESVAAANPCQLGGETSGRLVPCKAK